MLLVDDACPLNYAPEVASCAESKTWVRTATGEQLQSLGRKRVEFVFRDGSEGSVDYDVLPVTKTVLSVTAMNDRGTTCLMGPQGGFLKRPGGAGNASKTLNLVR